VARKSSKAKVGKQQSQQGSQRKVVVFVSLLAVMTVTCALLLALAPAPLAPGAASSLFAVGTPDSLDQVFNTAVPLQHGRWRYVFIHHSRTDSGNAATMGESAEGLPDHFVIGNGDGCDDGEVQVAQRWNHQKGAGRVEGLKSIDSSCISICLVGDFNRARPTPTQLLRLTQLVGALQTRCGVPAAGVRFLEGDQSTAGVGRYFPAETIKGQLLP
jgi:hypothetical protein